MSWRIRNRNLFGFVADSEREFYHLNNKRFILEGFNDSQEIESIIKSFKEEI